MFKVDLGEPSRFETVGQLTEAIHLQLYVYNHCCIHLALKMAPNQYLAKQTQLAGVSLETAVLRLMKLSEIWGS